MNIYADNELERKLRRGYERAGLKLDMGKCCVRFRKLSEVDLEIIGDIVAATSMENFIAHYAATRGKQ